MLTIMIMKKLLLFIFTLLLPLVASADDYGVNIDGICYNLYDKNKTAEVTYSTDSKYSGDVVIPATVTYNDNQYRVTSIGQYAFRDCSGLTSITIPNSVTNIGYLAFYGCTGLTSVTIPNSVTSIGNNAFYYCTGLTSITIPNSVTSIGDEAFYECDGVTSITIPNSVTSIGYGAFYGCTGLTSITIPNSVTSIGDEAFYRCVVTKENFNNQSNIPPSGLIVCDVRTESGFCIKDNALVKYLGKERTITIPNSVTSIGDEAFYRCSKLTSITIPNSVTNIGDDAFADCSGLTSVTIPNNVTNIGDYAFAHCSILTSVTIPNSVTNIGEQAFWNCPKLTSITIPNSVTQIESGTFRDCSGLTSITIPNSVTTIGYNAFDGCRGLTSITIPNSVTTIGNWAFNGCRGLTSITIPNSVTNIGDYAFSYCTGLTSITIPNSVTTIGSNAFDDCKNLKTVYCYATKLPETSEDAFGSYYDNQHYNRNFDINYATATLYVPASAINEYKATAPWSWFGTILPIEDATTQIDATSSNNCNIITNGSNIIVKSDADGEKVSIYTFSGQLIGTTAIRNGSAVINTNLKPGSVAIVMIGQNTYKIRLD